MQMTLERRAALSTRVSPVVYVVDDDITLVNALVPIIRSLGHNVRRFTTGEEFLEQVDRERPGCVVLDVRLPGISGFDVQQQLATMGLPLPTIFITGHGDVPMAVAAIKKGAFEFLEKPCDPGDLTDAIDRALTVARSTWDAQRKRQHFFALVETLTPDERHVMSGMVLGRSSPEMARMLDVSVRTVQSRRASVLRKLGLKSRTELIQAAFEYGWSPVRDVDASSESPTDAA